MDNTHTKTFIGMTWRIRHDGIGKAKYAISFHDGAKKHKDGSAFFDLRIFNNIPACFAFRKELLNKGYVEAN